MNSPFSTRLRELALLIFAYLLWGWYGVWVTMLVGFAFNIFMECLSDYVRRKHLAHIEELQNELLKIQRAINMLKETHHD